MSLKVNKTAVPVLKKCLMGGDAVFGQTWNLDEGGRLPQKPFDYKLHGYLDKFTVFSNPSFSFSFILSLIFNFLFRLAFCHFGGATRHPHCKQPPPCPSLDNILKLSVLGVGGDTQDYHA